MHKIIGRLSFIFFSLLCEYAIFFYCHFFSLYFSPRNMVYHYIFISFVPHFRCRRSERYVRMHMALVALASQLIKFPSFLRVTQKQQEIPFSFPEHRSPTSAIQQLQCSLLRIFPRLEWNYDPRIIVIGRVSSHRQCPLRIFLLDYRDKEKRYSWNIRIS